MDVSALSVMQRGEDMWWYRGRRVAAAGLIRKFSRSRGRVLDVGAGFGGMFRSLSQFGTVDAYEPDPRLKAHLSSVGYGSIKTSLPDVRAGGERYALAGAFDVIEHDPDDEALLRDIRGALSEGGAVVISVPAYQWLWSAHDVANHHYRRYTRGSLKRVMGAAGFDVVYAGYWNCILFPIAAIVRRMGRTGPTSFSLGSKLLDAIFGAIVTLEARIMPRIPLPWGLSVFAVGLKRADRKPSES